MRGCKFPQFINGGKMLISLEAIPRSRESLEEAAKTVHDFTELNIVNVPDLVRFPLRSWEACGILSAKTAHACIPHVRAIDFALDSPFPFIEFFRKHSINRVLVIAGDAPKNSSERVIFPTQTVPFIKKLKQEMPELKIYAAFDPYRSNIRYEIDYLKAKEDAGAEGFMSQPFFDTRLLEIYAEYLEGKSVFWGVSPILSEQSRLYWESQNRAVFPKRFSPTMEWNVNFGRRVIEFCETCGFNLYLMPIKVDIRAYLSGLFLKSASTA
ncbi:MAG: methylenetetrahydrofolate reductase [Treponema sp.]|jgi:methylenetetrahydrofolate reductase (NADPH)|nr:methylenetetrahydrofolate reductase [Treponema sp.]